MKQKTWILLAVLLEMLGGCGQESAPTTPASQTSPNFELAVQLPAMLTQRSGRYERFRSRVAFVLTSVKTRSGYEETRSFLPSQWDQISLATIPFPKVLERGKDRLDVRVEVWDRDSRGQMRGYPAASGKISVAADDVFSDRTNTLAVRLTLRTSVHEYDP